MINSQESETHSEKLNIGANNHHRKIKGLKV